MKLLARLTGFLNTKVQPSQKRHGYHIHIEQYRGLCALLVLLNHATVHEDMLFNNFKWPAPVAYLGAGFLSVIIFFCISGYVIGLTNDQNDLNIKLYLKKRIVRLYPSYLFAILLCIVIAGGVSLFLFFGNLFFLQNSNSYGHFQVPIFVNYSTWSLNYEVFYYLLFIPLFFVRPKVWQLLLGMLVLSVVFINVNQGAVFLPNYLNGFYFWILGLFIGWKIINTADSSFAVPLLSMLFLHLCYNYLGLGPIMLSVLHIKASSNFSTLFFLPFCLMIMGILTQKDNLLLKFNKGFCYAAPGLLFIYLALHHRLFEDIRWIMCIIFWCLSLIFFYEKRFSAIILNKLTNVGKISYAIYLFHVPIAELVKKTIFISNRSVEIPVKYMLWISLTVSLAILFDIYLQPALKKVFLRS